MIVLPTTSLGQLLASGAVQPPGRGSGAPSRKSDSRAFSGILGHPVLGEVFDCLPDARQVVVSRQRRTGDRPQRPIEEARELAGLALSRDARQGGGTLADLTGTPRWKTDAVGEGRLRGATALCTVGSGAVVQQTSSSEPHMRGYSSVG